MTMFLPYEPEGSKVSLVNKETGEVEWVRADAYDRIVRDCEDYREALEAIASGEKHVDGDTVDIAQKVLAKVRDRRP